MHAAIAACFDGYEDKSRTIWRIDELNGVRYLLLVSKEKPDLTEFTTKYGVNSHTKEYSQFISQISNGQKWRFMLRANPVHSVFQNKDDKRGKVFSHVTADKQKSWLCKHAESNGFELDENEFDVTQREIKKFWREKKLITLAQATYEGVLTVTSASDLQSALTNGIGRGKAYGCGLLTLARLT
jgi:CRISPR system Cascade subunit CasE